MQFHTPRGVRTSVLTLVATSVFTSGLVFATPASATTTPTSGTHNSATAVTAASASVGALASTAALASATAVAPTSARLAASSASVSPGATVKFTGKVVAASGVGVAGLRVVLQELRGSTWATVAGQDLSASGTATFTRRPLKAVQHRLRFRGGTNVASATSAVVATKVTVSTAAAKLAKVLAVAKSRTGSRYVWGAAGPSTFDCSGLTMYAYRSVGVSLPHKANSQKSYGRAISRSQALPGDLIIFLSGGYGYHAAIYAGGGYMYDAPRAGSTVGLHKIWSSTIVFRRLV